MYAPIKELLTQLQQSRLFKQSCQMMGWQVLSKIFNFGAIIWTARCLGPEKLGMSGWVIQTIVPLLLFTHLGLDLLAVREFKHGNSVSREILIGAYTTLRTGLGILYMILGVCLLFLLARNTPYFLGGLVSIPYFFFSATPATWLLMAKEDMPNNSRATTVASMVTAIVTFMFFRPGQLVFSDVAILGLFALITFIMTWRAASQLPYHRYLHWKYLKPAWSLALKGRWMFLTGLAVYIYLGLGNQLLVWFCSVSELGKFQTANRLSDSLQQLLVITSVLIYPRIIEWYKRGNDYAWKMQIRATVLLGVIGLCVSAGAWVLSPVFYHLCYGDEFIDAALPFALLVTAKCVVMTGKVCAMGLYAKMQDRTFFFCSLGVALVSLILNLYVIPRHGMIGAAAVNLFSETLIHGVFFIFLLRQHRKEQ